MKPLKDMLDSTIEQISSYIDSLDDQLVRTQKDHNTDKCDTNYEPSFNDFVASVVSMKVTLNPSYVGEYTSIRTALQDADYYAPINLTDLIFCSESALNDKNKSQRSRFIKCILNEGLYFVI